MLRRFLLHTAAVHARAHLKNRMARKRLHLIMPCLDLTLLTSVIVDIPLTEDRRQSAVVELTVIEQRDYGIHIDRNTAAAL